MGKDWKKWQYNFVESILSGAPIPGIIQDIRPGGLLSKEEVLEVYRDDYQVRLTEVLEGHFLQTHKVLGDDLFYQLTREFLKRVKTPDYKLDFYGKEFPSLLKEEGLCKDYPFLEELARLEYRLSLLSFEARIASQEELNEGFKLLETCSWGQLSLHLVPHITVDSFHFPVGDIYSFLSELSLEDHEKTLPDEFWESRDYNLFIVSCGFISLREVDPLWASLLKEMSEGGIIAEKILQALSSEEELKDFFCFLTEQEALASIKRL